MTAKTISVRRDALDPWLILPGSTGELSEESASADDSIFGTNFTSMQPTLISWTVNANAYFKGFPGYQASLRRAGTAVSMVAEPTALVGNGYYIIDRDRSLLDRNAPVIVNDDGVAVDPEDIEYIDYLQGGVVFVSGYVVTGPVTITADYRPTTAICFAQTFSLTQTADTENVTDFCSAQNNNGHAVFRYQRQTVELSLDGFYNVNAAYSSDLITRDEVIIEINPDGEGKSVARGYFKCTSTGQSGDVGNTETQNATYMLFVPEGVVKPFTWYHDTTSSIPAAVKAVLDGWEDRAIMQVRYEPESLPGQTAVIRTGDVLISDVSMESGVEDINTFTVNLQGSGELSAD